jgi:hypothetical protein
VLTLPIPVMAAVSRRRRIIALILGPRATAFKGERLADPAYQRRPPFTFRSANRRYPQWPIMTAPRTAHTPKTM